MCLILSARNRYGKPQIATEDIYVYKAVIDNSQKQSTHHKKGILTLYREKPIKIGSTYRSKFSFDHEGDIEQGLHCFMYRHDAEAVCQCFTYRKAVKCVIPKGSSYYKGWFSGVSCYASNKLTYLEFI